MRLAKTVACKVVLGFLFATPLSHAQTAGAPVNGVSYDAVSIKPNTSGSGFLSVRSSNGRYSATNVSIKVLLQTAYDIKENLIAGVPGAIDSQRFDIEAKIVEPDPDALKKMDPKERRALMLPVLVERFHLRAHIETKILPVFELRLSGDGPKFKPTAQPEGKGGGVNIHSDGHGLEMTAREVTMESYARVLSDPARRTVIDKTGLTDKYDLTLKWSGENSTDTSAEAAPVIFTALQEQLGLKLVQAKGPVETLVVDHIEMPTEN